MSEMKGKIVQALVQKRNTLHYRHVVVPPLELMKRAPDEYCTVNPKIRQFTSRITTYLEKEAPKQTCSVLVMSMASVSVTGESGIGKSETALELVKNGHDWLRR